MLSAKLVVFQLKQKAMLPSTLQSWDRVSKLLRNPLWLLLFSGLSKLVCCRQPWEEVTPSLASAPLFPLPKGPSLKGSRSSLVWGLVGRLLLGGFWFCWFWLGCFGFFFWGGGAGHGVCPWQGRGAPYLMQFNIWRQRNYTENPEMRKVLPLDTWTWTHWCRNASSLSLMMWLERLLMVGAIARQTHLSTNIYLNTYMCFVFTWVLFVFPFNKHPSKQYYLQEYTWELSIFKQWLERVHRKQDLISEMQHLRN